MMRPSEKKNQPPADAPPAARTGGLYKNVKISVRAVNWILITLCVLIVALMVLGSQNGGFTVCYDSRGGTDVPPEKLPYGEFIAEPEPPTREGYAFAGWFTDAACTQRWDFSEQYVTDAMTLYAGWSEAS